MPLNSAIPLGAKAPDQIDPMAQYGQILGIQNSMNQGRLANLQYSEAVKGIQEKDRFKNAMRSAIGPDGTIDPQRLQAAYIDAGDAQGYAKLQKAGLDTQKAAVDLDSAKLGQVQTTMEQIGQMAAGMNAQNYPQIRAQLVGMMPQAEKALPAEYPGDQWRDVQVLHMKNATGMLKDKAALAGMPFNPDGTPNTAAQQYEQNKVNMAANAAADAKVRVAPQLAKIKADAATTAADTFTPEQTQFWSDYLIKTGALPAGLARTAEGSAFVQKVMRHVASTGDVTPSGIAANAAEFAGTKAGERAAGTRQANIGMAVNEADQFADLALQASEKVPRGKFTPVNAAIQSWQNNTGDPNIAAFGAANLSLINAYATAVSRGGVPTDASRGHASAMLATAQSPDQYKAVVAQLKREMAAAKASPDIVRDELRSSMTGEPAATPPDLQSLVDEARKRGLVK